MLSGASRSRQAFAKPASFVSNQQIYFETLSLSTLLMACLTHRDVRRAIFARRDSIQYLELTRTGAWIVVPILNMLGIVAAKLDFEMRHVKDERGELLRLRIHRHDLFLLREKILASEAYAALFQPDWKKDRVQPFVEKGLIDGSIMVPGSVGRIAYLVGVVQWCSRRVGARDAILVVRRPPWFEVLAAYAGDRAVTLLDIPVSWRIHRSHFGKYVYKFPRFYVLLRNIKENGWPRALNPAASAAAKIYVHGRGEVNLRHDGYHSDFYWLPNSSCAAHNLIYTPHSETERSVLSAGSIKAVQIHFSSLISSMTRVRTAVRTSRKWQAERQFVRGMLESYNCTRAYWRSVFEGNQVKIHLTWYRYENLHMAIADAARDVGGISVYLPIAFDGWRAAECMTKTDIAFSYSSFGADIERQCGSSWEHLLITGYPRDYAPPLLKAEAVNLRKRLEAAGARKIVFVIDENSVDDPRWHTGHALQRENYSFILEQLLAKPWLGVVFKPKVARTLRRRLGPVAHLLAAAESTGRCYVYEATSRDVTSAPPVLAGLSADVCIHAHLCSGTAALECALAGLPTLLIDREGTPDSKFYELPRGTVVFQNWPDAIDALMEHFGRPGGIPGFGDWSSLIGKLDPFQDGLAAKRIGDHLSWLVEGFEQGLDRDVVMAKASDRYAAMWGNDKVIRGEATPGRIGADAAFAPRTTVMN
jgi:hypothetical protein